MAREAKDDPITAEVISMALQEIVLEMAITVERTSGSPGVAEAKDYSCVMTRPDGRCMAYYGNNLQHLGSSLCGTQTIIGSFPAQSIKEGDVFIYNDPHKTGALHQCDVAVQTPAFHKGELVAWFFTNVHEADIGGMSPWGFCPESTDCYAEGLNLPPVKILEEGVPNLAIFDILKNNSRSGGIIVGDTRSAIAANNVGVRRLIELLDKYGIAISRRYVAVNEELVSKVLRERISKIPQGVYQQTDWVEYDAFGGEKYLEVPCTLKVKSGKLTFDFTGAAKQALGYVNASKGAMIGSIMPVIVAALLPDLPVNAGVYSCFDVEVGEPGTITNPIPPAGVSGGHMETGPRAMRAAHATLTRAMSLSQDPWVRSRAYAAGGITAGVVVVTGHYADSSRGYAFLLDQQSLGHGALPVGDGVDFGGIDYSIAGREPDVEIVEASGPVLYLWRKEIADSGGVGLYRGGNTLETGVVPWSVESADVTHVCAGAVLPTQGSRGGYPGGTSRVEIHQGFLRNCLEAAGPLPGYADVLEQPIVLRGKTALISIGPADLVRQFMAGGAGWGDPTLRDPARVAEDVRNGSVSRDAAYFAYGVVLTTDGQVDGPATAQRRWAIRAERLGYQPKAEPKELERPRQALNIVNGKVSCDYCGYELGSLQSWQLGVVKRESNLADRLLRWSTPIVQAKTASFVIKEYICPDCGTLLETLIGQLGEDEPAYCRPLERAERR